VNTNKHVDCYCSTHRIVDACSKMKTCVDCCIKEDINTLLSIDQIFIRNRFRYASWFIWTTKITLYVILDSISYKINKQDFLNQRNRMKSKHFDIFDLNNFVIFSLLSKQRWFRRKVYCATYERNSEWMKNWIVSVVKSFFRISYYQNSEQKLWISYMLTENWNIVKINETSLLLQAKKEMFLNSISWLSFIIAITILFHLNSDYFLIEFLKGCNLLYNIYECQFWSSMKHSSIPLAQLLAMKGCRSERKPNYGQVLAWTNPFSQWKLDKWRIKWNINKRYLQMRLNEKIHDFSSNVNQLFIPI